MDDLTVQRVLVEYGRITVHLEELEASERAQLGALQQAGTALSATEREQLGRREQFALGRIEGLIEAQLAIFARRQQFARAHRPGSADWTRARIGRPDAAGG